jgi:hypothetical protein
MSTFTTNKRARLGPARAAMTTILGDPTDCNNLLQPLHATKGMLFPYTPTVNFGGTANYNQWHFTHSNYQQHNFQNSMPSEIQITGTFTAQTNEEGRYMLAVLRFLRASTMLEFGSAAARKGVAGTPPPVLRFNYLGGQQFNNVPVVLTTFNYLLEDTVDYVEVNLPGALAAQDRFVSGIDFQGRDIIQADDNSTYVPTRMVITLMLMVQQNPRKVRDNFDLDDFKAGNLINKGFL